jgi:hypothetical protein
MRLGKTTRNRLYRVSDDLLKHAIGTLLRSHPKDAGSARIPHAPQSAPRGMMPGGSGLGGRRKMLRARS